MNNSISIIMLGLLVAVCIRFIMKGWRQPKPDRETQKGSAFGLTGAGVGFVTGLIFGAVKPELFFSNSFLKEEGSEIGAPVLLAMAFSVAISIFCLLIYGFINKRQA